MDDSVNRVHKRERERVGTEGQETWRMETTQAFCSSLKSHLLKGFAPPQDIFLVFNSCSWLVKSCYSSSNYICCFRAEILSCNSYLGSNTAIPRTPSGGPDCANGGDLQMGGHSGSWYLATSASKLFLSDSENVKWWVPSIRNILIQVIKPCRPMATNSALCHSQEHFIITNKTLSSAWQKET